MSKAKYYQRGESLDYANTAVGASKIDANTIIELTGRIGIAGTDIAVGETGSVHVTGIYEITKTGTAAITMGQSVYFDGTGITDEADDGGSPANAYTPAGYAAQAAGASDTVILVKLLG